MTTHWIQEAAAAAIREVRERVVRIGDREDRLAAARALGSELLVQGLAAALATGQTKTEVLAKARHVYAAVPAERRAALRQAVMAPEPIEPAPPGLEELHELVSNVWTDATNLTAPQGCDDLQDELCTHLASATSCLDEMLARSKGGEAG
jgi:hypothetical protein